MNTTTSSATSFNGSRGLRYPAPDVARGFMLLLIALANVGFWVAGPKGRALSTVDRTWAFMRALFIDQRAYPLFALLFGFGLATMVNRRMASGIDVYCRQLTGGLRAPSAAELDQAREQATIDARRLVRRRGLWMVLFGLLHGAFFPSEIIGTYGIVAVVFAGWFAHKHHKRQLAVCALVILSQIVPVVLAMLFGPGGEAAAAGAGPAAPAAAAATGAGESVASALPWFVTNVNDWFFTALGAAFTTMILPAAFLGARLADTDLISHPERHRGLLTVAGIGGLALGALGALHELLAPLASAQAWAADSALIMVLGLAGGCGWLAVLTLYAGGPTADNRLTGLKWLLSNVGRRSMTAYLSQTVMFASIFVIAPRLTGRPLELGLAASAAVAVMVWLTTVVLCAVLERLGMPGPFEVLLRTAVARSERSRTNPFPQQVPDQRTDQLLGQPMSAPASPALWHARVPVTPVPAGA
ncbi:hypothetical protein HMPREF2883_01035 [Actinomyces sp. HMSC075C01]|uniref:DUF418 domain-containing protein n=1 Tax=Actinomyces oris TaxID=544580 RepID=A0A1Q8VZK8_9ACTO|nr:MULTISPECIES: DUF418 domain-containing protein [Actinomyces]OFR57965.1 hypothetical protein HMPREF2883_01035 [Actinomyces sp. HMSC075C01]OLO54012.1 hypothetical protein BKH27_04960 [Actinomyces oris]